MHGLIEITATLHYRHTQSRAADWSLQWISQNKCGTWKRRTKNVF